jgi:hypothetical protein
MPATTLSIQRHSFTGGGGVMHKVTMPDYLGWFSIWYDKDGTLLDAEAIYAGHKPRAIRPGSVCWSDLQNKLRSIFAK